MQVYYIDLKVLSILLQLEKDEDAVRAHLEYTERLNLVLQNGIETYISELNLDSMKKATLEEKLKTKIFENEEIKDKEPEEIELDEEIKEHLSNAQLLDKLENLTNELNKFIYKTYYKNLSEEIKQELENYIQAINAQFQASVAMMELIAKASTEEKMLKSEVLDDTVNQVSSTDEIQNPEIVPAPLPSISTPTPPVKLT